MKRRHFHGSLAALAWPAVGLAQGAAQATVQQKMAAAIEYFYPLYEMARARYNAAFNPVNPNRAKINRWTHRRQLSDHTSRNVTTPNSDTLYSSAWLDLSATPVQIRVPVVSQDRYWSIALMDMFSNHFAVLGSRIHGAGPVNAWVVGPDWQGQVPEGVLLIRSPSNDAWALGRWLINSPDEAATAHALQNSAVLEAVLSDAPVATSAQAAPAAFNAAQFLAVINEMIQRNPIPRHERNLVASWAELGIELAVGASSGMATAALPWSPVWAAQLVQFKQSPAASSSKVGSWAYPPQGIGNFANNYALRAHIALTGLAALETQEAVYLQADADQRGQALSGGQRYRLSFASEGFGAQAFWSLSMYEVMPDGRLFFTPNALNRFAIGDRTRGLQKDARGQLIVHVQHTEPSSPAERANWLPAPAGEFKLMLRAYVPTPALMRGEAKLPVIELLD
jgi:hypothetical protein